MTSVIVPAHNEARVIGRLLAGLLADARPDEFQVVVVSNGSTDETASVARRFPSVQVVEIPEASKYAALIAGDGAARGFPRLYVDADVELDTASARALVTALDEPGVLAVAPRRELRFDGTSWPVRAYHRIWQELPAVRDGLFGRGVIGINEAGFRRIGERPLLLGDDLFVHTRFTSAERRIVNGGVSVVRAPHTIRDLVHRRTRAAQGNAELSLRTAGGTDTTRSSGGGVVQLAARRPDLWPSLPVFLAVTALARTRARRQQRQRANTPWLRDDSTRG